MRPVKVCDWDTEDEENAHTYKPLSVYVCVHAHHGIKPNAVRQNSVRCSGVNEVWNWDMQY